MRAGIRSSGEGTKSRFSWSALLKPLDNGSKEIRALDGLRAVAATSIVIYHYWITAGLQYSAFSKATGDLYFYLSTGVHLFFVLSGFLLFLPYARAMLQGNALPSTRRFYQRRALRILPAYWVALAILIVLPTAVHLVPVGFGTVATHIVLIHDMFPDFNRDLEGPFWTLAVEVQFYLLLPLFAAALARWVGDSRSRGRLLGGIALLIALALGLRALDLTLDANVPAAAAGGLVHAAVLMTMGTQGKFLEVFALGMLCSALYVITVEMRGFSVAQRRRGSWLVLLFAGVTILVLALPHSALGSVPDNLVRVGNLLNPLLVGLGYAVLLLAILWGGIAIRWFFESPPLRFIGLMSYSLYIWHLPVLRAMLPMFANVPLPLRIPCAFLVAYLSYQLVERPLLNRRRRDETRQPGSPRLEIMRIKIHPQAQALDVQALYGRPEFRALWRYS